MKYLLALALAGFATTALAQTPMTPPNGPDIDSVVNRGDKNGDKALDKAEWDGLKTPYPFPVEADTNKDGKISLAEFRTYVTMITIATGSVPFTGGTPGPVRQPAP